MASMKISSAPCILVPIGALVVAVFGLSPFGFAHDAAQRRPVVFDADLGIDDVMALAMALQHPKLDIAGLVASEGVASADVAGDQLGRLAGYFNRREIPRFQGGAKADATAPPWRPRARAMVDAALPESSGESTAPLAPGAYCRDGVLTTVVVLGPLTSVASALSADAKTAACVGQVIVAGDPESDDDWNLGFDREASAEVRSSGVPLAFVRPGENGVKPHDWYVESLKGGQGTSLGEQILDRLLADEPARAHYLQRHFFDELAVLYLLRPELFSEVSAGIFEPADGPRTAAAIALSLSHGRQAKDRVVFVNGPLPATVLQPDVRSRRAAILANNGPEEWFAELMLNELHEHLGAYSIIGVKMALRAAELLNAPQHSMQIVSAVPSAPPMSCLNDGLLVATGSTPGRGLFRHEPGPSGNVEASFSYNGRSVDLRLKDEYRARIRATIQSLLAHSKLDDDAYWDGVRELGLTIWQDWHRRDIFDLGTTLDGEAGNTEREEPDGSQQGTSEIP